MRHFQLIGANLDVLPLLHAIQRRPDLWDRNTWRQTYRGTPHGDVSDIWLRYSAPEQTAGPADIEAVQADMRPVFYPAWDALPEARPFVFDLMRRVEAFELGRVLITRLRPGGRILPHADTQGGYVSDPDGSRYHLVLQGYPGSIYTCGGERVTMLTGQLWWFQHRAVHEVVNESADDRIHLLIDVRAR